MLRQLGDLFSLYEWTSGTKIPIVLTPQCRWLFFSNLYISVGMFGIVNEHT